MKKTILLSFLILFNITLSAQDITFEIGTRWVYETETYINPGEPIIGFVNYTIVDQIEFQGQDVFVLEGSSVGFSGTIYLYQDGDKIYFWTQHIDDFQLNYDFASTTSYTSNWNGVCHNEPGETATIDVLSTSQQNLNGNEVEIQHLKIVNGGSYEGDHYIDVIKGIGPTVCHPKLELGYGLCDFYCDGATSLRCFESNGVLYNFKGYPCDTTFIISSNIEPLQEDFTITPNPTNGLITINGLEMDTNYELFSVSGKLIQTGKTRQQQIFIESKGIFFLKLQVNSSWVIQKVIRI